MTKNACEYLHLLFPNGFENWEGNLNDEDLTAAFIAGFNAGYQEAFKKHVPSPFPGVK